MSNLASVPGNTTRIPQEVADQNNLIRNSEMNPNQDSSERCIEDRLLLKFLILRYSEMLETDEPRLDHIWAGLGMVALHQNRELATAFETLISSDSYTFQEVITSSIDLFLAELSRLKAADATDYPEKRIERRPVSSGTARKLLSWSWREGRKMLREKKVGFYAIWELISWLGLTSEEYIEEFDTKCRFSQSLTEKKLEAGLDVIKAAIFHRKIDNTVQPEILEDRNTN